jgi:hypothetical protein
MAEVTYPAGLGLLGLLVHLGIHRSVQPKTCKQDIVASRNMLAYRCVVAPSELTRSQSSSRGPVAGAAGAPQADEATAAAALLDLLGAPIQHQPAADPALSVQGHLAQFARVPSIIKRLQSTVLQAERAVPSGARHPPQASTVNPCGQNPARRQTSTQPRQTGGSETSFVPWHNIAGSSTAGPDEGGASTAGAGEITLTEVSSSLTPS